MSKLDPKALGLSLGILWAVACLFMGLMAFICPWGQTFVDKVGIFYIGFETTPVGIVIGMLWAFIDAFIGGYVLAWLYNKLAK